MSSIYSTALPASDIKEDLPELVQRALSCQWHPDNLADFLETQACAKDLLEILVRISFKRKRIGKTAGDRLPPTILEYIFSIAIAASGHKVRRYLWNTSRKFRCTVYLSQALWSDVATLPKEPSSFMRARARAWWTNTPLQLHLDSSNAPTRGIYRSHVPSSDLLLTSLNQLHSLIVEHRLTKRSFLQALHQQTYFPELEKLVLSSPDPDRGWGLFCIPYDDVFEDGVVVLDAPRLRTLHLRTVLVHLPETHTLLDVRLSARTRGSRRRPFVQNQWPPSMVHGLLARNNAITVLHLVEIVLTESEALLEWTPSIRLPALQELVVCSPSAKEPVWVLETLDFPTSTYLGLHLGHRATMPFDKSNFYYTLGIILKQRTFRSLTATSSLNLSGVLLSPEIRSASSALPRTDETESPLDSIEIAHTFYRGVPGAVDVFVAYQSNWVHNINPEYGSHLANSLSKAAQFDINVKQLRFWNLGPRSCAWDTLVKGLTGWSPVDETLSSRETSSDEESDKTSSDEESDKEESDDDSSVEDDTIIEVSDYEVPEDGMSVDVPPVVRDIIELMLSLFPSITSVYDCSTDSLWSSSHTYKIVEGIYRDRLILP
ncbi:hypothetical protein PENSPDRAFT_695387 [Peniophora sp. CONT]|nr:hypothetical protein PENSPDRAFT_695387 [Peniophora sp. CONT]